ncbi:MAG TPA: tRNA (adenosine(37)-N6)-threonylcarbamoyltransferase complex transferase subunit TsaD, partial [Rectinemataceae bacterium]
GGGVAANAYLRRCLGSRTDIDARFPSLALCGDNGAMVAGLAYHYFARGEADGLDLAPESRVPSYKRNLRS